MGYAVGDRNQTADDVETTMSDNDPAEIARQLTPAQRAAITRDEESTGNLFADNVSTVRALVKRGLAGRCGGVWFKLTDLGRAVRDAVMAADEVLSFASGTKVTWRAPSPEDGSNEIGTVLEDGRPFVMVQFGSEEPNTVNANHLRAVEPMRQQPHQQHQAADVTTTTEQRVCVTCGDPIERIERTTRYRHDYRTGCYNAADTDHTDHTDHTAQPKLAHPMDQDPFAGIPGADDDSEVW